MVIGGGVAASWNLRESYFIEIGTVYLHQWRKCLLRAVLLGNKASKMTMNNTGLARVFSLSDWHLATLPLGINKSSSKMKNIFGGCCLSIFINLDIHITYYIYISWSSSWVFFSRPLKRKPMTNVWIFLHFLMLVIDLSFQEPAMRSSFPRYRMSPQESGFGHEYHWWRYVACWECFVMFHVLCFEPGILLHSCPSWTFSLFLLKDFQSANSCGFSFSRANNF